MRGNSILLCCLAAALLTAGGVSAEEPTPTLRVGTFDSRGVALAYGRSDRPDCMMAKVAELMKEYEQAKAEGNEERVKELERTGPAMQEQIHKQVFGGAPIDDILALIEDDLPDVAAAAGVDLIVSGVLHGGPGVELVDITLEMCAPFGPDDETLKMIEEILLVPTIDESELSNDH